MATLFPAAGNARPSTALPGVGDDHDDNVYSSVVVAHGGVTQQTIFIAGQGTPIPQITGTSITSSALPAHYLTYTPVTTMIQQSGQLGNVIGDFSVRAMGITIDQCAVSGGSNRAYGATPFEVIDICSKMRIEVKLSGKRRILGPLWSFPQLGGPMGFTNVNASSLVGNGLYATGRRIASRFEIARNDTLTVEVTPDAALAFSQTTFSASLAGQATLIWVLMIGGARSDVR